MTSSSSWIYAASRGFDAILLTFSIMFSMGAMTKSWTSLEKMIALPAITMQTKMVRKIDKIALVILSEEMSAAE
jgi:hypothetical protein